MHLILQILEFPVNTDLINQEQNKIEESSTQNSIKPNLKDRKGAFSIFLEVFFLLCLCN